MKLFWCRLFHMGDWCTPPHHDPVVYVQAFAWGIKWCPKCKKIRETRREH